MKKGFLYRILSIVYKWRAKVHLDAYPINKSCNDSITAACFVYSNLERLKPVRYEKPFGGYSEDEIFQVGETDFYVSFDYDWMYCIYYTKVSSNIGKCYDVGGCCLKKPKEPSFAIELSNRIQDWYIENYGEKD